MTVISRFPPSPTGYLHIGSARTALFNWLFAKANNGKCVLRIEDTDKQRSTEQSVQAIINGLKWLNIDCDNSDNPVFQTKNILRHQEVAQQLLDKGKAYYCYMTPEEVDAARTIARQNQHTIISPWRDNQDNLPIPTDVKPVVRLRVEIENDSVTVNDLIQGSVTVPATQLDDMILLRADGTPTYMLSVVVDDYDMGVTHVIRGDDHLNNTFRQMNIYTAMGWDLPTYAHMPLIHSADGSKMSKRKNPVGIEEYRDMGYLSQAINSYLLTLGWTPPDDAILTKEQAIALFDVSKVHRSPAKFDLNKLNHINNYFLKQEDPAQLIELLQPIIASKFNTADLFDNYNDILKSQLSELIERSSTLIDIVDQGDFLILKEIQINADELSKVSDETKQHLVNINKLLQDLTTFDKESVSSTIKGYLKENGIKFKDVGQPLRLYLSGSTKSALGLYDVLLTLGKETTVKRLSKAQ